MRRHPGSEVGEHHREPRSTGSTDHPAGQGIARRRIAVQAADAGVPHIDRTPARQDALRSEGSRPSGALI